MCTARKLVIFPHTLNVLHDMPQIPLGLKWLIIQGGPEFMVQTLMLGRGHEDKHYSVGNHRAQTSSVGTRGR